MNEMRKSVCFTFIFLSMAVATLAQQVAYTREQVIALTPEWKGERSPDGRPIVPDNLLNRLKNISLEEAWGVLRNNGYNNQFEGDWMVLHQDKVLVGRALTVQYLPKRKDVDDLVRAKGKSENRVGNFNSWPIDMLKPGDVYVADSYGKIVDGTLIGDNLGNSIYAKSKTGVIFYGSVRDTEGREKIEDEYGDPRLRKSDGIFLETGKRYKVRVEAIETFADAQVQLVRAAPKPDLRKQALDAAKQADAIIMCMGITPRIEGEEMDVKIDGFIGGDRTRLDLPLVQQRLIKDIHALGKPVILVLRNGSALAINWESKNIPAIIEVWYPGQAAGAAIADVIFGDYNPSGILPVTFYKSEKDLPPFDQYELTGQTYRFFKGEPLYPLGFGLSYTTFQYSDLTVGEKVKAGYPIKVSVKNTGQFDGDEVVQLYISKTGSTKIVRKLKAFKRVHLRAGEQALVEFMLPSETFSVHSAGNELVSDPGKHDIAVGGGQPDQRSSHAVIKSAITIN